MGKRALSQMASVLLTLNILFTAKTEAACETDFGVHQSTVSRVFSTTNIWLFLAFKEFASDVEKGASNLSPELMKKYGLKHAPDIPTDIDYVVTIDSSEVLKEASSNRRCRYPTFSQYYNAYTVKFLIGLSLYGHIMFVSAAYPAGISDVDLTQLSGLLALKAISNGGNILADRVRYRLLYLLPAFFPVFFFLLFRNRILHACYT